METGTAGPLAVSRRTFLGLAAGALLLAGCSGELVAKRASPKAVSAADLLGQDLFYIAHRGSGDNWTEHTLHAYRQALAHGAQAIEISVHRSKDGHFICHHDASLERLCGVPRLISETAWDELQALRNDARQWLGPNAALEPLARLETVLEALADQAVLFIEDKSGQHAAELIEMIAASPVPIESTVWKQPATGTGAELASAAGMKTWGYFAPENFGGIEQLAGGFDALGIHDSADPGTIERAVATGLPVICWEVHRRSQRDWLARQGVRGMMCSNLPYVTSSPQAVPTVADGFTSGLRAAGDLPDAITWKAQPQISAAEGILTLGDSRKASYALGSMALAGAGNWRLKAQIRWPQRGSGNQIAGLAFGLPTDEPYRAFEESQADGFHLQLESHGEVSLWRAGGKTPHKLGRAMWNAPSGGEWAQIELVMADGRILAECGGEALAAELGESVAPGYLNLLNLIPAGHGVDFRKVSLELEASA
ncbi:glycerophosphodiester phosphodiesterase [Glutamicibacter sp.]|uniref:glycerophosphodiester phosphodiesterase n=1 Tax=Glutamicibacter sp. TaxID=1931995 RepID=UPI002FCC383E